MNNVTLCAKRRARLIAVMMAALAAGIATQGQAEERRYMLDLPLDTLERALTKLSLQSSQQIIFSRDLLAGRTSTALRGLYSTDDALDLLLRGSGLFAERSPRGTILIRRPDTKTRLHRTSVIQVAPSSPTEIGRDTSELQALMRISYAVFCLKKKKNNTRAR